jgi:bacillithiol biosynthesis deacetylase BshB1
MTALDLLVIAAHPDDAEISVGGTLLAAKARGLSTGVLDLTRGEMGTHGTPALRAEEARAATAVLGLDWRDNLNLPDARLVDEPRAREAIAEVLRAQQPRVLLVHDPADRHPDHVAAAHLARAAAFLAGLVRLADAPGLTPAPFRPTRLFTFFSHEAPTPGFVVDIGAVFEDKLRAVRCFASQLGQEEKSGTHLGPKRDIVERTTTRARFDGARVGIAFGEALSSERPLRLGAEDLFASP